ALNAADIDHVVRGVWTQDLIGLGRLRGGGVVGAFWRSRLGIDSSIGGLGRRAVALAGGLWALSVWVSAFRGIGISIRIRPLGTHVAVAASRRRKKTGAALAIRTVRW